MATHPTFVGAVSPVIGWASSATPKVSPDITTAVGDVLLVLAGSEATMSSFGPPTNTGTAFDWSLVSANLSTGSASVAVWTATATAAQTCTVSCPATGSNAWSYELSQWRGAGGVGNFATGGGSRLPQTSLSANTDNSGVVFFGADFWGASGTPAWLTANGSAMTQTLYNRTTNSCDISGYVEDAGFADSLTYGLSNLSSMWQYIAVEITAADAPPPVPMVKLRAAGAVTGTTAAVTAVNPAVPAGTVTGDLSVLVVCAKPYNTTITTPAGWTKIGENTNGTVAIGTDLGSTKVALYVKESAAVGAIGVIVQSGANSMGAVIHSYYKDPAATWDYSVFTTGGDTTNAANYSATGVAGLDVATGDRVIVAVAVNGDVGTPSAITLGGMAGATLGSFDVSENAVTTGMDISRIVGGATVRSGSSNAAPTLTYTNTLSGSGAAMWLRIRAVGSTVSANALFTGAGTLTAAATGKAAVTAPFTAVGVFTAAATRTGAVTAPFTGAGTYTAAATRTGAVTAPFTATGTVTATAAPITAVTALFAGAGALTVIYGTVDITSVTAPFTGSGAFIAAAAPITAVTAAFTGSGAFTSTATPLTAVSAPFTAAGTLTAAAATKVAATAPFTGAGAFAATAVPRGAVTAPFTAVGAYTATTAPITAVTAAFTATGALTATLGSNANINAAFTGTGTYTAALNPIMTVSAPFTAAGVFTAVAAPGVPYRALVTADEPSLYWRLGETAGTTAVDASGNGLTGTYSATGVTLTQTSPVAGDTAARFAGASSGHVDRAITPALQLGWGAGRTWTIEFWLRMDSITVNAFPGVLGTGNGNVGGGNGWAIYFNASAAGNGSLWFRCNGIQDTPGPIIPTTNTWYHIAVTNTGAVLTWYVNGTQVGAPFTNPTAITPTSTAPFTVNPANYGDQSYDELAIYPTALPAARINAHYSNAATAEVTATAPFTGTGTLTAATAPAVAVTAEFTSDGALTAVTGTIGITSVAAPFTSDAALTAAATPITTVTAPFTGVGVFTSTAAPQATITAPFTAAGVLTAATTTRIAIPAPFTGAGTLTTANTSKTAVTAPFTATGAFGAVTISGTGVTAPFTGDGVLTATTSINAVITCLFTSAGTLTATTTAATTVTAPFTAAGALTATTTPATTVTAPFTGSGAFTAPAAPTTVTGTTATFTGTGTLTATTTPTITTTALFNGAGAFTAAAGIRSATAIPFTGTGTLTCITIRAGDHPNVLHPHAIINGHTENVYFTRTGTGPRAVFTAPQHPEAALT